MTWGAHLPGSYFLPFHTFPGVLQARILEYVAILGRPRRKDLSSVPPRMRDYDMGTQDVRVSHTLGASTSKPGMYQVLHGEPDPEFRFI